MLKQYEKLNLDAKEYIIKELGKRVSSNDKEILNRCYKEINILYEKGLLFIIEHLYKYKKKKSSIQYHFRGMINNLFVLYILDLSKVDPLKYQLPYELFMDQTINVDVIRGNPMELIRYLETISDFKMVAGSFEKCEIEEINKIEENHYLFIPNGNPKPGMKFQLNESFVFETIEDYRSYTNQYLSIRIDEKLPIINYHTIGFENVINKDSEFEMEIAGILKPQSIEDYIKLKSLSHGTRVWKENQDRLFQEGKLNLQSLIATCEDIVEYLLNHQMNRELACEITNFIRRGHSTKYPSIWNRYVEMMREHHCDEIFIEIVSKILFIFGRGQAISECLFVLDKKNYIK